jgi:hypothetical protein
MSSNIDILNPIIESTITKLKIPEYKATLISKVTELTKLYILHSNNDIYNISFYISEFMNIITNELLLKISDIEQILDSNFKQKFVSYKISLIDLQLILLIKIVKENIFNFKHSDIIYMMNNKKLI